MSLTYPMDLPKQGAYNYGTMDLNHIFSFHLISGPFHRRKFTVQLLKTKWLVGHQIHGISRTAQEHNYMNACIDNTEVVGADHVSFPIRQS